MRDVVRTGPFCHRNGDLIDAHFDLEANAFTIVARNGKQNKEYFIGLDLAFERWIVAQNRKLVSIESSHKDLMVDLTDVAFWPSTSHDETMRRQITARLPNHLDYVYPLEINESNSKFIQFLVRNIIGNQIAVANNSNSVNSTPAIRFILDGDIDYDKSTTFVQEVELLKAVKLDAPAVGLPKEPVKSSHEGKATRIDPEIDVQVENMKNSQIVLLAKMYLQQKSDADRQSKLKSSLPFERCALSDWDNWEAAHVKQRSDCDDETERFDERNVIPLSPNLHDAFDRNEFGIGLLGNVVFSSKLRPSRRGQLEASMHRREVDVHHVRDEYLVWRFDQFKSAEAK